MPSKGMFLDEMTMTKSSSKLDHFFCNVRAATFTHRNQPAGFMKRYKVRRWMCICELYVFL
jgi:hypothetical protein